MRLSEDLQWRGLIKDRTFEDIRWLDKPQSFYLGIDAVSADSLTVGNLAVIMLVKRLATAGWKAFLVMGGGTSLVGDPGGKTDERKLVSREVVKSNIAGVRAQVNQLFRGEQYTMVDNYDWLSKLKYVDFLREVGKHFSMTELMQRDFVAERMGKSGTGISYAEFSYSLVQGYDFWHLFNKHNVVMQIGGSDQWGNLLSGVSLIRKRGGKEAQALSMPLVINKSTGQKFGKSENGAVWLDPRKTSVYQFYQFWLNTDDQGVGDYLKIFTELDKDEITDVMTDFMRHKADRRAQKTLAYEVTKLVHGKTQADNQKLISEVLYGSSDPLDLGKQQYAVLMEELPVAKVPKDMTKEDLVTALVTTKLASSKTEARHFLNTGAVYINNAQIKPDDQTKYYFDDESKAAIMRRGKNSNAVLKYAS